jgi:hypothetical protein
MTIRIEDIVVMEDMVCGYEIIELEHHELLCRLLLLQKRLRLDNIDPRLVGW